MLESSYRLGFDIGGTFTDVVLVDQQSGRVHFSKVPSTPADQTEGALAGIAKILSVASCNGGQVEHVVHGSTVATNAILERKGAVTAMLTTAGFRDVLAIGRSARFAADAGDRERVLYDINYVKPAPLVPRSLRLPVRERIGAQGEVVTPLDLRDVEAAIEMIDRHQVQSVAICFLNSYADPIHERKARDLLLARRPALSVCLSSEVLPEFREYERFSTAVLNAYVMPSVGRYLQHLESRLGESRIQAPLQVMQATGGTITSQAARRHSVHTALSGIVGGVLGGSYVAGLAGFPEVITMDMGGTSTDVSVVRGGKPQTMTEGRIGPHSFRLPVIDVHTIGAGGGSIARVDADGGLRVGPESAGADPGPVCYGKGGSAPTVTDADLVLGRLPSALLDGVLPLDPQAARMSILRTIGEPLSLDAVIASHGIIAIAAANMIRAIRLITIERGIDPRELTLVAFGGAGPLHAGIIAKELQLARVLIPRAPGVLSALGLLTADTKHDYVRTSIHPTTDLDPAILRAVFAQLEERAQADMHDDGVPSDRVTLLRSLDFRYRGQGYEVNVELADGDLDRAAIESADRRFHRRHETLFGHSAPDEPTEVVNARIVAVAPTKKPQLEKQRVPERSLPAVSGRRRAFFAEAEGFVDCPVYRREALKWGHSVSGPALVDQFDSTTVLLPGQSAVVDEYLNLVVAEAEPR